MSVLYCDRAKLVCTSLAVSSLSIVKLLIIVTMRNQLTGSPQSLIAKTAYANTTTTDDKVSTQPKHNPHPHNNINNNEKA